MNQSISTTESVFDSGLFGDTGGGAVAACFMSLTPKTLLIGNILFEATNKDMTHQASRHLTLNISSFASDSTRFLHGNTA